jgi:hypothetical protein
VSDVPRSFTNLLAKVLGVEVVVLVLLYLLQQRYAG